MDLQLMQLRKAAGYKSRDDFARALNMNPLTYKGWETGRTRLKMEDACMIADFLGCSLDELAGRWEYVGRHADPRQREINDLYGGLDEDEKDTALGVMQGVAAAHARKKAGAEGPEAGQRSA